MLVSPGFARNERLSRFLRYLVERHLEGRDEELKESLIAIEVFGRPPGYDSKRDPIVRTEASRLRARLNEYYLGEGKSDSLVVELPKGGYVPLFLPRVDGHGPAPPRRLRHALRIAATIAFVLVALVAVGWWWFRQNAPIGIAVMPLENLGHDSANDYFADGLTDELIRNLSMIDGLSPRSRTSSFAYKGKPRNVREAGQQLQVEYILEGSILRSGQQLRINAQLIRVRDDFTLWSGKFDRELTDVFAVQEEISRGIVNSLRLKLGRGRRRYETNTEAYDLYLRARALGFRESIVAFEEAIAKDPSFAPAYAGLAATYAYRTGTNLFDRADELAKMRSSAEKALELDPLLAEAHAALGTAYARDGQWVQSEKGFHRAIELDPNSSRAHQDFAMYLLFPLGRIEEAVHEVRLAEKADPLSPGIQRSLGFVLIAAGRFDEATAHCRRLTEPGKSECLGRAMLGQGKTAEAVELLAATVSRGVLPGDPIRGYLGYAYARAGRHDEAEKIAAADALTPFHQAVTFSGLGDKDRTFEALGRMTVQGPVRIGRALMLPELAALRGDPRVKALRKKVGLPE
jgi:TolB-like protein/Tfp pilus assembly protein PilF